MTDQPATSCDVLVVGGGPAGSTASALLAMEGFDVVTLEKEHHPRFHIGESLLPMNLPLLEKLGVKDEVAKIGMMKWGAEFVSPWHPGPPANFEFGHAWDKSHPYAYQVRRSVYDELLFRNAAAKGAKTIEGCKVTSVDLDHKDGVLVTAQMEDGTERRWIARFLVDASGRETVLANKFGIKRANMRHHSAAVFGHFTGAKRLPGREEGHITVFWFDHGWFWFIPLSDGTTSVGAVGHPDYHRTRKGDLTQFLMDTIALCPPLVERLKDAQITGPATATGNFSYNSDRMYGRNYVMIGDAWAFVDPVFSSGVYLGMSSAFRALPAIKAALRDPARAPKLMAEFDAGTRRGVKIFSWFIYRMTRPAFRDLFMRAGNPFRIQEAIMSLLAGDIFRPSPVYGRLAMFKAIFYAKSFRYWLKGQDKLLGKKAAA